MGACAFIQKGIATSVCEAFAHLVEMATEEYGNDSYNGTISTCDLGSCKKMADVYSEAVYKKAMKYVEEDDYGHKRIANALDLGVVRYEIVSVKKNIKKVNKPAKFALKYAVVAIDNNGAEYGVVASYDKKTDADNKMIDLTVEKLQGKKRRNNISEYIVAKRYVNINNGEETVTTASVTSKTMTKRPKKIPQGCILREFHCYLFYGWAAE